MRSTTNVVMGIRNVGVPEDAPAIFKGTFTESILQLSQWLGPRSMGARFDMVIARSEEEVRGALRIRERDTKLNGVGGSDLESSLRNMMEQANDQID